MSLEISQLPNAAADDAAVSGNSTANLTLVVEYPENATAAIAGDNERQRHGTPRPSSIII